MNRFRTIAVTAVAGFVLVACGPAASGSAKPSAGGAASQPAASQAQASQGVAGPSFTAGAVADLEALIPDKIGTLTMQKSSMQGNQYLLGTNQDPATVKFLQDLGVSPSDVSMAVGFGFSADAGSNVVMFVFRAKGADASHLITAFKNATAAADASPVQWTNATVGGKQVQSSQQSGQSVYLYVKDDILFFVSATDPATAEQILSGLP